MKFNYREKRIKDLINENAILKEENEDLKNNDEKRHKSEKNTGDFEKRCLVYEYTFKKLVEVIYTEERKRG